MKYINFYKYLSEAPIQNYTILQDPDEDDSFLPADKRLISNKENIQKIHRFFKNTPYIFDLYFYNNHTEKIEKFIEFMEYGETTFEELKNKYDISIPKPINSDTITVIFVSNYGTNLIRLTPWIIAHRIGHVAERKSDRINSLYHNTNSILKRKLIDLFSSCYYTDHNQHFPEVFDYNAHKLLEELYPYLFTFKTAREKNLTSIGELYHELFAQYINKRTVEVNIPENFKFLNRDYQIIKSKKTEKENVKNKIIDFLNSTFIEILNSMKGNVYII